MPRKKIAELAGTVKGSKRIGERHKRELQVMIGELAGACGIDPVECSSKDAQPLTAKEFKHTLLELETDFPKATEVVNRIAKMLADIGI